MPKLPSAGSGTLSLDQDPVSCGDLISFTFSGTDGLDNPAVYVTAHQNGVLTYGEIREHIDQPGGQPFPLGGGSSDWLDSGGGPAECVAQLFYRVTENGKQEWNGHGQQGPWVILATCAFAAA